MGNPLYDTSGSLGVEHSLGLLVGMPGLSFHTT